MKTSAFTTFLFSGVLAILATDSPAEVPRVETNFGPIVLDQRVDKRFRDIIPPERIQRIICLGQGQGFADHDSSLPDYHLRVQADYDALVAHLIASNEKAGFGFGVPAANEGIGSRLLFVTTDNQIFDVEILLIFGRSNHIVSAILIRGAGINARINVKGFKRAAPSK